ncbi:hypothetical protein QE152_g3705 [Popillia japonica]|uniref:Uncharacterized protein n=1 Tax=Popillia japonica TaxID=7064 RepID=A0AAW1N3P2_POPJA
MGQGPDKVDVGIDNPKSYLAAVDNTDVDYLQHQQNSINKVDQLIEEAELSLKELRKQFYEQTTDEELKESNGSISNDRKSVNSSINTKEEESVESPAANISNCEESAGFSLSNGNSNGKPINNKSNSIIIKTNKSNSQEIKYIEYNLAEQLNKTGDNGSRFAAIEYVTLADLKEDENLQSNSQEKTCPQKELNRQSLNSNSIRPSTDSANRSSNKVTNNDDVHETEAEKREFSSVSSQRRRSSGASIIKETHTVSTNIIPTDYIEPISTDYKRFLGVKNSIYLKPSEHGSLCSLVDLVNSDMEATSEGVPKEARKSDIIETRKFSISQNKNIDYLIGNSTGKPISDATTNESAPLTKKEDNKSTRERKLTTSTPELPQDLNTKTVLSDKKLNGSMVDTGKNGNKKSADRKNEISVKKSPSSSRNINEKCIPNYSSIPAATIIYSPRGTTSKKKECRKNRQEAANLYRERFPERSHPAHTAFNKLELKLRTGSFLSNVKHADHNAPARNEENVIKVSAYVAVNPHVCLRFLAEEIGVCKNTVHRILEAHRYHPFKIHLSQELRPNDLQRRLSFIARLQVLEDANLNIYKDD